MSPFLLLVATQLASLGAQPLGPAHGAAAGYSIAASEPFPAYGVFAALRDGSRVQFDGRRIVRADASSADLLAELPGFVFPSFVVVDDDERFAYIGESSNDAIMRVALASGALTTLASLHFNFEADFLDAQTLFIGAAPCGFYCGSDLFALDVASGALSLRGHVGGPSGPFAFSREGDLYYARQSDTFPTPPGAVRILRWSRALIASGAALDELNATAFGPGLDGCADMVFDPSSPTLFVSVSRSPGTSALLAFDAGDASFRGYVASGTRWISNLSVRPAHWSGTLQRFQPRGPELLCMSSDFTYGTGDRLLTLTPRPARAQIRGAGLFGAGELRVRMSEALPNAAFALLRAPIALYSPDPLPQNAFGFLFHAHAPLGAWEVVAANVPTDPGGNGTLSWFQPSGAQATHVYQALVQDRAGRFIGATNAIFD